MRFCTSSSRVHVVTKRCRPCNVGSLFPFFRMLRFLFLWNRTCTWTVMAWKLYFLCALIHHCNLQEMKSNGAGQAQLKAHLFSLYVQKQIHVFITIWPSLPLYFHVCLTLGWMLGNASSRGQVSPRVRWLVVDSKKTVSHRPPLLLCCRPADIHFLSDVFLNSCSVGVVCPRGRRGNIINVSVISDLHTHSFLKKFHQFSKIFFFIFFLCLTVGYTA